MEYLIKIEAEIKVNGIISRLILPFVMMYFAWIEPVVRLIRKKGKK